jgi:two-component system, NarL family, captular synthesis response regulator RcsB
MRSVPVVSAETQQLASDADSTVPSLARVVLVDARPERLQVMRMLLDGSGLVSVVGEAHTRNGAVEEVGRAGADLVIVEIQMPVDEGLATVASLRRHFPALRVVVCSFDQNAATRQLASENGADAYLGKPIDLGRFGDLLRVFATTTREPTSGGLVAGGQRLP